MFNATPLRKQLTSGKSFIATAFFCKLRGTRPLCDTFIVGLVESDFFVAPLFCELFYRKSTTS